MRAPARIAVVDYGMGNRRSVHKALERAGATVELTRDHDLLRRCDGLVVPGVGAFPVAMRNLRDLGLAELLCERAEHRTPLLGICLGMQLLFDCSGELELTPGLGLIPGRVSALDSGGRRVPHIGWTEVRFLRPSPLTVDLPPQGCPFYHVHSLAARAREPADVIGESEYGERFATIVGRGRVFGVQFHPEKSSAHGVQLLSNFVSLCEAGAPSAVARTAARA